MMNFTSASLKDVRYESAVWYDSKATPGVRYCLRRTSLARRIELTNSVRELCLRHEFLKAGDAAEQLEAALRDLLIRRLYMQWGVADIRGLRIDGRPATVETLIENGPELLADEIISCLRAELGLTDEERKTPDRIPFSIFFTSRVELRKLSEERLSQREELRVGVH